jgi:hypothetical protein
MDENLIKSTQCFTPDLSFSNIAEGDERGTNKESEIFFLLTMKVNWW